MEKVESSSSVTQLSMESRPSKMAGEELALVAALGLAQLNVSNDQRQELQQAVPKPRPLSVDAIPPGFTLIDPLVMVRYRTWVYGENRVQRSALKLPVSGGIAKPPRTLRARAQGTGNLHPVRPGRYVFTSIRVKYEGPISSESPSAGK